MFMFSYGGNWPMAKRQCNVMLSTFSFEELDFLVVDQKAYGCLTMCLDKKITQSVKEYTTTKVHETHCSRQRRVTTTP